MNLRAHSKQERELKALAESSGKPGESQAVGDEEAESLKQRHALEELLEELDALPPEGFLAAKERPVSDNVDESLYGWKK